MPETSDELVSYIAAAAAEGKAPDLIRTELKAAGWADADIDVAFGLPPRSRRKWKRPVIIAASIVVFAVAAVAIFVFLRKAPSAPVVAHPPGNNKEVEAKKEHDDAALIDNDLVLPTIKVAVESNGYLGSDVLNAVTDSSDINSETDSAAQLSGEDEWDQAYVEDIIKKNSRQISAFATALQKPDFQIPEYSDPSKVGNAAPSLSFSSLRLLSRILALEALVNTKKGDVANGAAEALAIATYGQRLAASQVGLLGYLAGLELKKLGLETFQKVIALAPLATDMAIRSNQMLVSYKDTASSLVNAYKMEYWFFRGNIEYKASHPDEEPKLSSLDASRVSYLFEPNKTINLAGIEFRKLIKMANEECREFTAPTTNQKATDDLKTENAYGQMLVDNIPVISYTLVLNKHCDDLALVASVREALAPMIKGE